MKLIALEEHLVTPDVVEAWRRADPSLGEPMMRWALESDLTARLLDLDEQRLADMDDAGIDVSVLSLTTPGLQNLPAAGAVALQAPTNDLIAAAVARHPDRLEGFAALAMQDGSAAAAELRRTVTELGFSGALVNARTDEHSLDHPSFWDVYEAAADLRAPIYLHPRAPRADVRDVYYAGYDAPVADLLATGGIGWHYDAGLTVLRMILGGVFDRFPDLQVVLGHWGEVVLFYLDRIGVMDAVASLERPVRDYFRSNIHVTPGGIASQPSLRWAIETLGADRVMYASDYPFNRERDGSARRFLEDADVDDAVRNGIAHGSWESLVADIRR